jgi:hypothetical protein
VRQSDWTRVSAEPGVLPCTSRYDEDPTWCLCCPKPRTVGKQAFIGRYHPRLPLRFLPYLMPWSNRPHLRARGMRRASLRYLWKCRRYLWAEARRSLSTRASRRAQTGLAQARPLVGHTLRAAYRHPRSRRCSRPRTYRRQPDQTFLHCTAGTEGKVDDQSAEGRRCLDCRRAPRTVCFQ